jgi:hypothetical protein
MDIQRERVTGLFISIHKLFKSMPLRAARASLVSAACFLCDSGDEPKERSARKTSQSNRSGAALKEHTGIWPMQVERAAFEQKTNPQIPVFAKIRAKESIT